MKEEPVHKLCHSLGASNPGTAMHTLLGLEKGRKLHNNRAEARRASRSKTGVRGVLAMGGWALPERVGDSESARHVTDPFP